MKIQRKFFLILFFSILFTSTYAYFVENKPITLEQPDGTKVYAFITGDEYYQRVFDKDNFTIIRDKQSGMLVYALLEDSKLVASKYIVGRIDPKTVGLQTGIDISAEKKLQLRKDFHQFDKNEKIKPIQNNSVKTTELNFLVIFIKFADQTNFPQAFSFYENMCNETGNNVVSMRQYFLDASHDNVDVVSHFFPLQQGTTIVTYTDSKPRSYYCPYNATTAPDGYDGWEEYSRKENLLKNAINYVASQVPSNINFDSNGDGKVDNTIFIVRGETTAWSTLLWPHQSQFWGNSALINGKEVATYNFQLEEHLVIEQASVLVHETYHSFGLADYYRYNYDGTPIGTWDVMAGNTSPIPQACSNYLKNEHTYLFPETITEITTNGIYTINNIWDNSGNNSYKIRSPYRQGIDDEFFIVEFRNKSVMWEQKMPGSGLVVFRVNPTENGNGYGPPDEFVVIGGQQSAYMSYNSDRYNLSPTTTPPLLFSDEGDPGFAIFSISPVDTQMTFEVIFGQGISAYPKNIDFGNKNPTNELSIQKIVNIHSLGLTSAISAQIIGADSSYFTISDNTIDNQGNGNVKMRFVPTEDRVYNAILRIISGSTIEDVPLTGKGIYVPPVANFTASTYQCFPNQQIQFFDKSLHLPISWNWTFENVTPDSSTLQNPIVTFSDVGTYTVSLIVHNDNASDTITKTNIIIVEPLPEDNLICNYSFENWTDGIPNCWSGTKNTFDKFYIKQSSGAYEGNFSCRLENTGSNKKIFSTKELHTDAGQNYKVEFYTKGIGQIYVELFDGTHTTEYNNVITIDDTEYSKVSRVVGAQNTSDNAEFLLKVIRTSAMKNHLIIDAVTITETDEPVDSLIKPEPVTIDNKILEEINIFPNPTSSDFVLTNCENAEFQILDINGTIIKTGLITSNNQTINIDDFSSGCYFIKLFVRNNLVTKKIIKI